MGEGGASSGQRRTDKGVRPGFVRGRFSCYSVMPLSLFWGLACPHSTTRKARTLERSMDNAQACPTVAASRKQFRYHVRKRVVVTTSPREANRCGTFTASTRFTSCSLVKIVHNYIHACIHTDHTDRHRPIRLLVTSRIPSFHVLDASRKLSQSSSVIFP